MQSDTRQLLRSGSESLVNPKGSALEVGVVSSNDNDFPCFKFLNTFIYIIIIM